MNIGEIEMNIEQSMLDLLHHEWDYIHSLQSSIESLVEENMELRKRLQTIETPVGDNDIENIKLLRMDE